MVAKRNDFVGMEPISLGQLSNSRRLGGLRNLKVRRKSHGKSSLVASSGIYCKRDKDSGGTMSVPITLKIKLMTKCFHNCIFANARRNESKLLYQYETVE